MSSGATLDIVKLCLAIDQEAVHFYAGLAVSCESADLKAFWKEMSKAEKSHLKYWEALDRVGAESGLPEVFEEPELIRQELQQSVPMAQELIKKCTELKGIQDAFLAAYKLEFYMLHPAFATLFHTLQSLTGGENPEVLYEAHLDELIEMAGKYAHLAPELDILGGILRRLWKENRRLARQALSDSLTGLLTRRAFVNAAVHLGRLAQRRQEDVALIIFDIDDFKEINDQLGHQQGDAVLKTVAQVIRSSVRASDLVGRYGGEEFVVLLYGANLPSAHSIAEKIRLRVAQDSISGVSMRVSAGVAAARIQHDAVKELEDLLRTADDFLLSAKRKGKNRIEPEVTDQ